MVRLYHVHIYCGSAGAERDLAASSGGMWCLLALPAGHRQGEEGSFQLSLFVLQ